MSAGGWVNAAGVAYQVSVSEKVHVNGLGFAIDSAFQHAHEDVELFEIACLVCDVLDVCRANSERGRSGHAHSWAERTGSWELRTPPFV